MLQAGEEQAKEQNLGPVFLPPTPTLPSWTCIGLLLPSPFSVLSRPVWETWPKVTSS